MSDTARRAEQLAADVRGLHAHVDDLHRRIRAVRNYHTKCGDTYCFCSAPWPCETLRLLDGEQGDA